MNEIMQILSEMDLVKGLSPGASYRELQRSIRPGLRQRVRDRAKSRDARTPKPEVLFRDMIVAGEVKIVHRRFKAPLVVCLTKSPKRRRF